MKVANCSTGNSQVRINTQSQRGVIWACVLVLAVFGGACAMAQVSAAEQAEIDKFCAKHGTDVKKRFGDFDETLLHIAAKTEGVSVIQFLIDKGADVNAEAHGQYFGGQTPLHYAATFNKNPAEVIKLLVEKGADVNAKNSRGWTPLHCAAKDNENPEVLKLLIEKGADVNAKNSYGKTPLQLAENAEVREYIAKVQEDEMRAAEERRNAFLASAIELNAEIKKSGLDSIDEYVQYGASDLRKKLQEADEFDQPGIKSQIKTKQGEIVRTAFVGRYPYSTSNVKVEGNVSSVTLVLDTGFSAVQIGGNFTSPFPDVKYSDRDGTIPNQIVGYAFPTKDGRLRLIQPSERQAIADDGGFVYARFRNNGNLAFTIRGTTNSIKELVRGKDGYRVIVVFSGLSYSSKSLPITYRLINSDGTLRTSVIDASGNVASNPFITDKSEVVEGAAADVMRIEIVKQ